VDIRIGPTSRVQDPGYQKEQQQQRCSTNGYGAEAGTEEQEKQKEGKLSSSSSSLAAAAAGAVLGESGPDRVLGELAAAVGGAHLFERVVRYSGSLLRVTFHKAAVPLSRVWAHLDGLVLARPATLRCDRGAFGCAAGTAVAADTADTAGAAREDAACCVRTNDSGGNDSNSSSSSNGNDNIFDCNRPERTAHVAGYSFRSMALEEVLSIVLRGSDATTRC
jgi:hypothetical protein